MSWVRIQGPLWCYRAPVCNICLGGQPFRLSDGAWISLALGPIQGTGWLVSVLGLYRELFLPLGVLRWLTDSRFMQFLGRSFLPWRARL